MTRKLFSLLVICVLAMLPALALARPPAGGQGNGCGMGTGQNGRMEERLKLTVDQQKQVSALRQNLTKELEPIWTRVDAKRVELQTLWTRDKPERAAILAKQSEIETLREDVRAAHVDFRLAVHSLLTPVQRKEFAVTSAGCGQMKNGQGNGCAGSCACMDTDTDMY
jgi:Spy/CpxP family protein refolding chaperone